MWPQSILMDNSASAFTGDINPPNLNIKDINIKSQPQVLVSKEAKSDSSDTTIINKKNFRIISIFIICKRSK